ncbi:MAG: MTAP family purine nucleoside phosphorylase [Syntrophorhabdaceae bacterium]|nr:MTAP family purine nucleoside phosphorylase [Syntrophorhabdaceae bacterium]
MDGSIKTPFGDIHFKQKGEFVYLQRHGNPPVLPHRINHHGNIWALKKLGVENIIGINSVGSLKPQLKPGMFVIPDDFISLWHIPTFYEEEMKFTIPVMDTKIASYLFGLCKESGMDVSLGGTYIQTRGPRFETKAEINLLKRFGHVVGMTMASEVTLCIEYDIKYGSVCSIDNYCHGISKKPLTLEEVKTCRDNNIRYIETLLDLIIKRGFA